MFLGKLGRLEEKKDPRTFKLARYLDTTRLKRPPRSVTWSRGVPRWPMYGNDRYGDCTCAAVGHMIQTWTQQAEGRDLEITDQDVIAAYSAVSGFDPNTGANDNGAYLLDVLNLWRNQGIGGRKIGAFASAKPSQTNHIKTAINLFGGAYAAVWLPISAQSQAVWDVTDPQFRGDAKPGSWGGHCVPIVDYDADHLVCVTWGQLMPMTWRFFKAYFDEAYAVLSEDWIADASGKSPLGFDLATLQRDLQSIPPRQQA